MPHPIMFDDDDPILQRLREIALSFPGAAEKVSHGRPNFFTTKVFASYGGSRRLGPGDHERHDHALMFLPEQAELPAFDEDERFFTPAYVGPYGWRAIDLDRHDLDWDEVTELVDASYRLTAPKRLVKELDAR
ncbi:MAG: MmcQ/YjbR family DNA-binding protein [Nocardioidaceae bacterium]